MLVKTVLALLDAFSRLFRLLRVDYPKFRAIMETKLTLDNRRPNSTMLQHVDRESKNVLLMTLGFFGFMGLIIGLMVTMVDSPLVAMSFVFGFVMTFMTLTVIADFSSVLLDTADAPIIQPRPLDGRTILAARLAHISVYLLLLTSSLAAGSIIIASIRYGLVTLPVMLISLALELLFILFLVQVLYSLAMRYLSAERLREVILLIQSLAVLLVMSVGVVMTRALESEVLRSATLSDRWWVYLLPPSWFAAPVDMAAGNTGPSRIALTALAVIVPLAGIVLVIRVLGPRFGRQLERLEMEAVDAGPSRTVDSDRAGRETGMPVRLSGIVSKSPGERASFLLVWRMVSRDRQYRMRTYPMLALLVFYFAMFFFESDRNLSETVSEMTASNQHLMFLYYIAFVAPFFITNLKFSPSYEAAWVYRALPFIRPGEILLGGLKAVIFRYVAPIYLSVSTILVLLWGPRILLDIILAGFTGSFIILLYANTFGRDFPFSEEFSVARTAGKSSAFALLFFVPAIIGIAHAAVKAAFPAGIIVAIPIFLALDLGLLRTYAETPLRMLTR